MNGLMHRAMHTAAGLDAEVARQSETSEKQRALLDRVFALARASLDVSLIARAAWFDAGAAAVRKAERRVYGRRADLDGRRGAEKAVDSPQDKRSNVYNRGQGRSAWRRRTI